MSSLTAIVSTPASLLGGVEILEIKSVQAVTSLNGVVVDGSGASIPGVQVIEASETWEAPIRSTQTGKDGRWSLPSRPGQTIYYFRFRKKNFNEVRVRIAVKKSGSKLLKIVLPVST